MMQEGLRHFTGIPLTVAAMLIFLTTYVFAIIRVTRPKGTDFKEIERLPLEENGAQDE